ncbi:uncharacterized protein LOC106163885 isoform X2 [Lingula anatina]|nr:uncharacterized protein LOC106163885 isoform X2 [Lingula anatina]|eukprot:XP_013397053.1 uncharacterized protein LOC106163885 isoform X2 [Lingula anatina]
MSLWHISVSKFKNKNAWPSGFQVFKCFFVAGTEVIVQFLLLVEIFPNFPPHVLLLLPNIFQTVALGNVGEDGLKASQNHKFRRLRPTLKVHKIRYIALSFVRCVNRLIHVLTSSINSYFHSGAKMIIVAIVLTTVAKLVALPWQQTAAFVVGILVNAIIWQHEHPSKSADTDVGYTNTAKWEKSFFQSFFKLIVIMLQYNIVSKDAPLWNNGIDSSTLSLLFVQLTSALAAYLVFILCAKISQEDHILKLSSIIEMIISGGYCTFWCVAGGQEFCIKGSYDATAYIICIVIWIITLVQMLKYTKSVNVLQRPLYQIFKTPTFNSVFLTQFINVNQQHPDIVTSKTTANLQHADSKSTVFICTTMFHESKNEVNMYLLSLKNIFISKKLQNVNLETHIFMDDGSRDSHLTPYGAQLLKLIKKRFSSMLSRSPDTKGTPYGVQVKWLIDGHIPLYIHLKDVVNFKPKKRWSQVMYMHYILNYRNAESAQAEHADRLGDSSEDDAGFGSGEDSMCSDDFESGSQILLHQYDSAIDLSESFVEIDLGRTKTEMSNKNEEISQNETAYILATDADMQFKDEDLLSLLRLCNQERDLGGACGWTHPIGQTLNPLVAYQQFEYASDFWMVKTTENALGSVLCCPGCFSLYRLSALKNIIDKFGEPVQTPIEAYTKDTGEDRWMCTLLMSKGWKMAYNDFCSNSTFCPESITELFKQRRRWSLSTYANTIQMFWNYITLMKKNSHINLFFLLYQLLSFIMSLVTPASTVILIVTSLSDRGISLETSSVSLGGLCLFYMIVCLFTSPRTQDLFTWFLSLAMVVLMSAVLFGSFVDLAYDTMHLLSAETMGFHNRHLLLALSLQTLYCVFLYPDRLPLVRHMVAFLVLYPVTHLLLPIYTVCNMSNLSWGTREMNEAPHIQMCCSSDWHVKNSTHNISLVDSTKVNMESSPLVCTADLINPISHEEFSFWKSLQDNVLGTRNNLGLRKDQIVRGLTMLRNNALFIVIVCNVLWYLVIFLPLRGGDTRIYSLVLITILISNCVQMFSMTFYRIQATLSHYSQKLFPDVPVWINPRTVDRESATL